MVSFILFLSFISFALSTYLKSKQNYNLEVKLKEVTAEYDEINKKSEEQKKLLKEIKEKYEKASQLNKKLKTASNTESGIETKTISKRKELEKKKKRLQKERDTIKLSMSSEEINSLLQNLVYFHSFYEQIKTQIKWQTMIKADVLETFSEIENYFNDILNLYTEMNPKYEKLFSQSENEGPTIIQENQKMTEKINKLEKQLSILNFKKKFEENIKTNQEYDKNLVIEHCISRLTERICKEDTINCYWNEKDNNCMAYE